MDKIRIGFVGAGNMGQCAHLKHYAALPECEVVAIAELRPKLAAKVAARYGVPRVYASAEEMLAAEKPDGVVAAQDFRLHLRTLPALLKAGIPTLCEKPLAASIREGEAIARAVEESGTWLMVAYHKRSDPATAYAKAEIDRLNASGELGALRYVRILMPPGDWVAAGFDDLIRTDEPLPKLPDPEPPDGMDAATCSKYVTFVNYYIHQVNLLRHLLGEPYRVTHADPSGVLLVARSESGLPGVIEMAPYETTVDWQESALIAFERGYVELRLPAPLASNRPGSVEILRDPGNGKTPATLRPRLPWVSAMRGQAVNFVKAVRGEDKPPCEAAEALADLKIARDYIRLLTS